MQKDIIETVLILVTFFIATLVIAMYRNFDKILEIIKNRPEMQESIGHFGGAGSRPQKRQIADSVSNGIGNGKGVPRLIHLEIEPGVVIIEPDRERSQHNQKQDGRHDVFFSQEIFKHIFCTMNKLIQF